MADQGTSDLYQGQPFAGGTLGLSSSSNGIYTFFSESDANPDRDGSLLLVSSSLADGYFGNVFFTNTYPNFFTFSIVDSDRDGGIDFSSKQPAGGVSGTNTNINNSFPNYFAFSDINSSGGSGTIVTTYYKVRGYYVVGAVYEMYVTTTLPGTNPTGHTLIDLTVVSTWRV